MKTKNSCSAPTTIPILPPQKKEEKNLLVYCNNLIHSLTIVCNSKLPSQPQKTLPEGVRAYSLNNTASTSAISFDRIDRKVIPANTPIFIAANTANTFNCTAAKNSEEPLVTNLEGSVVPFKYFILIENKDQNAEFRRLERFTIPANRCHIRLSKEATATSLNISFPEAKPTGVVKVATETSTDNAIYNLAGQRIENTAAKGVVIVNGKKVVLP